MSVNSEQLLEMYRTMVLIREAEQMVSTLFLQGRLPGFIHSYIGEEATAVGVCSALRQDDYITSTHRGHGHILAKGGDLKRFFAELFGKETGYCNGKGGSMHVADLDLGILGANGIVGGGIPIAGGAAMAAKMQGLDRVAVSFLGDGAINTGPFHESLNLAAVWELPVVFVCENNGYANFMAFRRHTRIDQVSDRAAAYGMAGATVDGNDVEAVYDAAQEAVERARSGHGPTLLECLTYRWHGHYEGDPEAYRTKEEIAEWKVRDPLGVAERRLEAADILDEETKQEIWNTVGQRIKDAVTFAEESPLPEPESALEGVYTDIVEEGWS
jgi:pyruvate dehydrogenase E1 component alpha subunit